MYEPDALRKLVRNFADAEVGYVTGEARYLPGGTSRRGRRRARLLGLRDADQASRDRSSDRWSAATAPSTPSAGRCGATLPEDAINDFLNPLQIVEAGWRGVYEPEAVCYEETAGGIQVEYQRRVRIVSRSWRAVFQASRRAQPVPRRPVQLVAWSRTRCCGGCRASSPSLAAVAAIDAAGRARSCGGPCLVARPGRRARRRRSGSRRAGAVSRSMAAYFGVDQRRVARGRRQGHARPRVGRVVHAASARAAGGRAVRGRWCPSAA